MIISNNRKQLVTELEGNFMKVENVKYLITVKSQNGSKR